MDTLLKHRVELVVIDEGSADDLMYALSPLSRNMRVKFVQVDVELCANSDNILKIQPETVFLKDNIRFALSNITNNTIWFARTLAGAPAMGERLRSRSLQNIGYNVDELDDGVSVTNEVGMDGAVYPYMIACKKKAIFNCGLLDVRYMEGWACDDDDWTLRHRRAGHQVKVTDGMECYHINHNRHDGEGRVVNLAGSELHMHNALLLQNAISDLTTYNLLDRLQENIRVTRKCIVSARYLD
jgi:hypothetical protein